MQRFAFHCEFQLWWKLLRGDQTQSQLDLWHCGGLIDCSRRTKTVNWRRMPPNKVHCAHGRAYGVYVAHALLFVFFAVELVIIMGSLHPIDNRSHSTTIRHIFLNLFGEYIIFNSIKWSNGVKAPAWIPAHRKKLVSIYCFHRHKSHTDVWDYKFFSHFWQIELDISIFCLWFRKRRNKEKRNGFSIIY